MPEIGTEIGSHPSALRAASILQDSLLGLGRLLQSLDRQRGDRLGIPASLIHGLLAIGHAGPFTVTELGRQLRIDTSTASRLAKGLIARGLVRKRSPATDERRVVLQITEQGMRLSRRIENDLAQESSDLFLSMDPQVRERLPGLLRHLVGVLGARLNDQVSGE